VNFETSETRIGHVTGEQPDWPTGATPARAGPCKNRRETTQRGANAVSNPPAHEAREAKRLLSACHGLRHEPVTKTFHGAAFQRPTIPIDANRVIEV
jgi:hypothetical protein